MKNNNDNRPQIDLLNSIIDDELKMEENKELKEIIRTKTTNLFPLLSFLGTRDLDDDEIKKKIKSLIEEG